MQVSKQIVRIAALVFLAATLFAALVLLSACGGDARTENFVGTWDLVSGDNPENDTDLSEANVASMNELGLETYLNLEEDGSLSLVSFSEAKFGEWNATSAQTANASVEGQQATIELKDDTLQLKQNDTVLVFAKGNTKEFDSKTAADASQVSVSVTSNSEDELSDMIVRGELLKKPITIIDDSTCRLHINGVGTDRLGDPGFNLFITNLTDKPFDIWVSKPFEVDGKQVRTYLCETVPAKESITAFMQFDTADLASTSPSVLKNITGTLIVDNADGEKIATYSFVM